MNEYQRTPNENASTRKRQSRRRFLAVSAGTAIGIGAGPAEEMLSAQTPAPGVLDETTIVLVNGKIHTFDAANSIVNTVTIRHNRIVSVGGPAPKAGPGVRIINLRGRTVVPGLVEPHIHIVSLGNRPGYHTILENTTSAIYCGKFSATLAAAAFFTFIWKAGLLTTPSTSAENR
jgi:imidazolonepropionase-like amidohydrolase